MREGWTGTTLGEVATLEIGRTPSRHDNSYWTTQLENPFCTIADMDGKWIEPSREGVTQRAIEEGKARIAKAGSLLMSFKLTIGRVGFAACDLYPNEAIVTITPKSDVANREFLYLLLGHQDLTGNSGRAVKGSTLNSKSLAAIPLNLPSLLDQKRIVDLVSSVDAYIESLRQQVDAARTARNAVLHELLSAGSDEWTETTLGDVADILMGQSPPGHTYNTDGLGLPFMQGSAEFGNHHPLPVKWCSQPAKVAEVGDLLLSVRAPVGDTNLANQRLAVGRGLAVLRGKSDVATEFLRLVIQLRTNDLISVSGSGMFASITGKNLREFQLQLPSFNEQKQIVDVVSSIDEVITKSEAALSSAQTLRSGLLADLLSGEHEIPKSYDRFLGAA
jgi:type I restriction enzyme S subunit